MWRLFLQSRQKNSLLSCCILLFNLLAACLEGASFAFLLVSIATLTKEEVTHPWLAFLIDQGHSLFILFLSGAIVLQILRSLSTYLGQIAMISLTIRIQREAQKQIFEQIFHMSFPQVSEFKKGDLMHQVTAPPSFIPMLFDEYNRLIIASLMIATYLLIMGQISWTLTAVIMCCFMIAAFIQKFLLAKISKASQLHADHISDLSKQTAQSLDGLKTVHVFQQQEYMLGKMGNILDSISKATLDLKKLNALIPSINENIGVLLVGLSLLLGTFFLHRDGLSHASYLFTYLTLTYRLGTRLQHVMIAKGMISYYSGPLHKLEDLLAQNLTCADQEKMPSIPFEKAINFENVSLTYPHKKTSALKDISLTLPKRHVIALVGMSGAGKSSLIDILLRLHHPSQGSIKIDGVPIETFSLKSWRHLFGVVLQDPFLFNESIETNIRFGNLNASDTEILQAAKLAGADIFIQKLPMKYQTLIGEKGYRLSGGEKQRIALAQALIRNPEILVLDEATSHLDSYSEQMIQETLANLRREKTLIIVAHRLSTIQMADLIFVIDNGTVIEKGTHHHLLQLGGHYHTFWNLQTLPKNLSQKSLKII